MISNPKFYKKITSATAKLVNSLTQYEEGTENHDACKAFALSKFQRHRYLDVDGGKVERWINGMCEKFIIHSKPSKAEILKRLNNSFFESKLSESSSARSQTHYALLSILLNLSENPVNADYVEPLPQEKEDDMFFDWGKYLLEGEELPYPTQWAWVDTPPTSDEEDDEIQPDDGQITDLSLTFTSVVKNKEQKVDGFHKLKLGDELVEEYWKAKKHSGFTLIGELASFEIPPESCMKEINIIREVLWLLGGQQNLFAFPIVDGKHVPSEDIKISHSTSESFVSALVKIANYGDIVENIINLATSRQYCQTYQAFSESLLHFMKSFRGDLIDIERRLCNHEETLLLGDIIKILTPRFHQLSAIDEVLQNSVSLDGPEDTNFTKSSRLLGTLHNIILDQSDCVRLSSSQPSVKDILVQIWLYSLRPYFDMMDSWMTNGSLIDPYNEFIVQRSNNCPDVESDAFWCEAFILASEDCMKYLSWMRDVLHNVIVAGKSMEVLVTLGKIVKKCSKVSLHEAFVLNISMGSRNIAKNHEEIKNDDDVESASCDSMLLLNFERLFQTSEDRILPDSAILTVEEQTPIPTIIQRSICGLVKKKSQIADQALLNLFLNEYKLIYTLKCFHKFYLMEWGDVMYDFSSSIYRKISSGEYWEDLMSLRASLQEAISDSDPDADISFVTVALNKSKQTKNYAHKLIHATDIVELFFDIRWPLNIIITEKSREMYNTIFGYLMQIKHCLFCLENLKFDTIQPISKSESTVGLQHAHRLALLRSKILQFVSHWHNSVMTSVIQAEKEVFFTHVIAAENVDDILKAHNQFLERVMTLCLLQEKKQADKMIQGTLRKIFNLAVILHMKWNRGLESISNESLKKCESEYKECSDFLGIILQNLVSRGAVPLSLESLAFCLMS